MTVLLVLGTLVIFLIADYVVQRFREAKEAADARQPFTIPAGVSLAANHTWVKQVRGMTIIGLDDFIGRMVGSVESLMLPGIGAGVTPATAAIALCDGDRSLEIAPPVAGVIVGVNTKVLKNPSLARHDPYGAGWLLKIKTDKRSLSRLRLLDGAAAGQWLKRQTELAREFFAGALPGPQLVTLQDGGIPVDGVMKLCDAHTWKEFERQFTGGDTSC